MQDGFIDDKKQIQVIKEIVEVNGKLQCVLKSDVSPKHDLTPFQKNMVKNCSKRQTSTTNCSTVLKTKRLKPVKINTSKVGKIPPSKSEYDISDLLVSPHKNLASSSSF